MSDSEITAQLRLGLECLPNQERREEYAQWLSAQAPHMKDTIKASVDCYKDENTAEQCLNSVLQQAPVAASAKYVEEKNFCEAIVKRGEGLSHNQYFTRNSFLAGLGYDIEHQLTLPASDRDSLHKIATFYSQRAPSAIQDIFDIKRGYSTERQERWDAYEIASYDPQALNPVACDNEELWERHDLKVEGFPYLIPVYHLKDNAYPWVVYEESFRHSFQQLKFFITPDDMKTLLNPDGESDASFYIVADEDEAQLTYPACGITGSGGRYYPLHNRIAFRLNKGSLHDIDSSEELNKIALTFYHEMAHRVDHAINHKGTDIYNVHFNSTTEGVASLREWSMEQAIANSVHRKKISDTQDIDEIAGMVESGEIVIDAIEYLPFTPITSGRGMTPRWYCTKNAVEFFAEWADEYISTEATFDFTRTNYGEPVDARMELKPPQYARYLLMKQYFAKDAIHPEALTKENIEAVFRSVGIDMNLPAVPKKTNLWRARANHSKARAPHVHKSTSSGLSVAIRLGGQSITGTHEGAPFQTAGMSLGFALGYYSRSEPTGFIGGAGVGLDFITGANVPPTDEFDFELDKDLTVMDNSLWGLLGTNLGSVDLIVYPEIGLRYPFIDGSDGQPQFWLGGRAGLAFAGGGLSILATGRFLPSGGNSFGGVLQADIPTLMRWDEQFD